MPSSSSRVKAVEPAGSGIDVQHRAGRVLDKDGVGRALEQIPEALLALEQGLLGPDALQRAAAMVGQRLQQAQILMVVGLELVALDGQNANDLGPVPNGRQHQRSRGPRSVADRNHVVRHGEWFLAQDQLRPLRDDRAGPCGWAPGFGRSREFRNVGRPGRCPCSRFPGIRSCSAE